MIGLGRILDEHWDPAEADFHRYYQADLADAMESRGARWINVRLMALPAEAAVWRSVESTRTHRSGLPIVRLAEFAKRHVPKERMN